MPDFSGEIGSNSAAEEGFGGATMENGNTSRRAARGTAAERAVMNSLLLDRRIGLSYMRIRGDMETDPLIVRYGCERSGRILKIFFYTLTDPW